MSGLSGAAIDLSHGNVHMDRSTLSGPAGPRGDVADVRQLEIAIRKMKPCGAAARSSANCPDRDSSLPAGVTVAARDPPITALLNDNPAYRPPTATELEVEATLHRRRFLGDNERIFGVPSVRSDLPAPGFKSVADGTNYGDVGGAALAIRRDRGVDEAAMAAPMPRDEILALAVSSGALPPNLPAPTLDRIWSHAVKAQDEFWRREVPSGILPPPRPARGTAVSVNALVKGYAVIKTEDQAL
eukprot:gnl/Ergobibamus_cyprinoides/3518.p2 GENE.gnl/Ergobibamus_cyprinoides/3518~~gnl/Ergobibamus_cyprinoides/3518.p2  ORF type:complete len:243 (+),score=44.20 gnl/Ergobibamus_cyprinoides/3518:291-1019(+)